MKAHLDAGPVEPDIVLVRVCICFPAHSIGIVETVVAVLGGRTVRAPGLIARVNILVRNPIAGSWRREVAVAFDEVYSRRGYQSVDRSFHHRGYHLLGVDLFFACN